MCIPLVFRVRAVIAGWVKGVEGLCAGGEGGVGGATEVLQGNVVSVMGCEGLW